MKYLPKYQLPYIKLHQIQEKQNSNDIITRENQVDNTVINQTDIASKEEKTENERNTEMNVTIKINGMMCPHCSGRVRKALEESPLVVAADVSHERADAIVTLAKAETEETVSTLKAIINDAGYETP